MILNWTLLLELLGLVFAVVLVMTIAQYLADRLWPDEDVDNVDDIKRRDRR